MILTADTIRRYFTRKGGTLARIGLSRPQFLFRRWSVPISFDQMGLPADMAQGLRDGLARVAAISGAPLDPTAPPNFVAVGCDGWDALLTLPELDTILPQAASVVVSLKAQGATQYRTFHAAPDGGVGQVVAFYNLRGMVGERHPAAFGLSQALLCHLNWAPAVWQDGPIVTGDGPDAALRPGLAGLLAAAYAPGMPPTATDAAFADRLAAAQPHA